MSASTADQQARYRALRAAGKTMMTACVESGLFLSVARLIESGAPLPHEAKEETMAKRAKPGDAGSGVTNLSETKQVIREAVAKILALRSQRKEINQAMGEQRARVKNYGVPPAALDLALRMKEADAEDQAGT
jgi:hypothetical protein